MQGPLLDGILNYKLFFTVRAAEPRQLVYIQRPPLHIGVVCLARCGAGEHTAACHTPFVLGGCQQNRVGSLQIGVGVADLTNKVELRPSSHGWDFL